MRESLFVEKFWCIRFFEIQIMKTVRDACKLQPNALAIKLSDQIEQLDELIHAEGDGTAFFEKTFITAGMQELISEGIARLAAVSSTSVFHLKQAMGRAVRRSFARGRNKVLIFLWP